MSVNVGADTDAELRDQVRSLTNYDQSELSTEDLKTELSVAKLVIKNRADVDMTKSEPFYNDDGLTQALLFTTCIFAKAGVENIALDRWNVGDINIETWDVGDASAQQFKKWNTLVAEGLKASDVSTAGPLLNVTNSFP